MNVDPQLVAALDDYKNSPGYKLRNKGKQMRILITGGAGFVGRRFCKRLVDQDHIVECVDNLIAGQHPVKWMLKPATDGQTQIVKTGPLATSFGKLVFSEEDARQFFQSNKPDKYDLIIHCAAIVGGRLKIDGDPLAVATDLGIDADFFSWVVRAKNRPKIVYFSSSAVYPLQLQTRDCYVSLSEQLVDPPSQMKIGKPDMTYGWSKLSGEVLAQYAVSHYNADVVIYRPFGGYGEDQSFDYPFPSIIRRIISGESPVTVWGSGDQQRDFIYIEDIIDAVLATMHKLKPGETLNLGTGLGVSFRDLAHMVAAEIGRSIIVTNDSRKPEGVFSRVSDSLKLNDLWEIPEPLPRLKWGIRRVIAALDERRILA